MNTGPEYPRRPVVPTRPLAPAPSPLGARAVQLGRELAEAVRAWELSRSAGAECRMVTARRKFDQLLGTPA